MFKPTSIVRGPDASEDQSQSDLIGMRKKWYQRIVLFKDGGLQGWFVNTVWTFFTMTMLGCGFFIVRVREGWVSFGSTYAFIYLGGMAAWFAYKIGKAKVGTDGQQESVTDALKKVAEAMSTLQGKMK